ncbi:MAG: prepilin-type N-terminal cleavage/methylation domain-containing protein [Burkholderiaceae bacterium]|nr:prepilin-type N-terminal cleavage/methylation domain-containing protein [Burkholderiaceae bacterium]
MRGTRRAQAGFTLLELVVVVAIVGVVAGLAAPQIGDALADNKAARLQLDVVRLARQARARSAGQGRAHVLYFIPTPNNGLGQMEIWQGVSNRCNGTDWGALGVGGAPGACAANAFCWDAINPLQYGSGSNTYRIGSVPAGPLQICFEPDGRTLHRGTSAQVWSATNLSPSGANIAGAFTFNVTRLVAGSPHGVARRVLLPLGGDPRVIR